MATTTRMATLALTLALTLGLAPRAEAADFVWNGANAAWNTDANWDPDATSADYTNATRTFLVTSGTVQSVNGGTFTAQLTVQGNGQTNYSGGTFEAIGGHTATLSHWHLDGGRFYHSANANVTMNGALTVDSDSFWDIASGGKGMDFNAFITGSGSLKVKISNMGVNLNSASNSYSGVWILLPGGSLNASAANCLGTGWVDIVTGGALALKNNVSNLTGSGIVVRAGASLSVEGNSVASIRMQGGTLGTLVSVNGAYSLGGSIYLDAPSTFKTPGSNGKWVTVNSTLYGTNGITVTNFPGATQSLFDLTVDNSATYTGAWTVVGGQLKGSAVNAFGAGTVTATTGTLVAVGADQTIPVFYMGTGSTFYAAWGYTRTISNLHVAGATIDCDNQNKTLAGTIYVDGPSTLSGYESDAGRSFTVNAPFRGSQRMTFNHTGGAPGPLYITGDSRSTLFSGGWTIQAGTMTLQNALGLGGGLGLTNVAAGPLTIMTGGKLSLGGAYNLHVFGLTLGTTVVEGSYRGTLYNVQALPDYATYFSGTTSGSTVTVYSKVSGTALLVQ